MYSWPNDDFRGLFTYPLDDFGVDFDLLIKRLNVYVGHF